MQERQVLVLNSSEEVLRIVDWRDAVRLLVTGKAFAPFIKTEEYRINSTCGEFRLPKVLVLMKYVHTPYKESTPTKRNVMIRDKWTCQYCGRSTKDKAKLTIDHVVPRSRGGDSTWTNLVAACERCNGVKGNKTPKEAKMPLKEKPRKPTMLEMHIGRAGTQILDAWDSWLNVKKMGA
jgi:5-methylcytosine-specific restriction endonuclease McrA